MGRFESRITIHRPLKTVFDVYTQPDTFRWADVRSVTWVRGNPWELENRMHISTNDSFGVTTDQVVTHFEPYRRIRGWLVSPSVRRWSRERRSSTKI